MIRQWKWKSLSRVWLFATLWTIYTLHGILQARILEWVTIPSSRGSSQPRDQTQVSHIICGFFTSWATREAQEYWSGQSILSPVDLPDPGIKPGFPALRADSLPTELSGKASTTRTHHFCGPSTKRASFNLITSNYPMNPNSDTLYKILLADTHL